MHVDTFAYHVRGGPINHVLVIRGSYHRCYLVSYRNTSTFISSVLTGYFSSNLASTVGCNMPKTPMTCSLPPIRKWMAAAWPGKKVGSSETLAQRHFSDRLL